jgi:uncharacterized protein YbcI
MKPERSGGQRTLAESIGNELLRVHQETYGRGAGAARTLIADDAVVVFLDDLELQPNEEFLVGAGEGQAVVDVRGRFQDAIDATFRAVVERATGRRVISFASATKLNPHYVVEVFRLAPSIPNELEEPRGDYERRQQDEQ